MIQYWKGNIGTAKEGWFGTVDGAGSVPDSEPATQTEYAAGVASRPEPVQTITPLQTDITAMDFTSLVDAQAKIKTILERMRSGER